MTKRIVLVTLVMLLGLAVSVSLAFAGGIDDTEGVPLYVIIEVTWNGDPEAAGSWTVWGPLWDPVVDTGDVLASCSGGGAPETCLDMSSYEFVFRGKAVHFDEVYVPGVIGHPQVRHVVLHDTDGDETYSGSLPSECYEFPGVDAAYHDRIDYEITFDSDDEVTDFYYLEYEHKKLGASCEE